MLMPIRCPKHRDYGNESDNQSDNESGNESNIHQNPFICFNALDEPPKAITHNEYLHGVITRIEQNVRGLYIRPEGAHVR